MVYALQQHFRTAVELAQEFARRVEEHPRLKLVVPPMLSLVCFQVSIYLLPTG